MPHGKLHLHKFQLIVIVRGQNQHPGQEGWWSKNLSVFLSVYEKKAFEQRVFYLASLYLVSHSLYKSIGMSLYAVTNVRRPSAANI